MPENKGKKGSQSETAPELRGDSSSYGKPDVSFLLGKSASQIVERIRARLSHVRSMGDARTSSLANECEAVLDTICAELDAVAVSRNARIGSGQRSPKPPIHRDFGSETE